MPAKVWIIGAGPGPADLLTLRALSALRAAEVVLYDDLVSAEVLALCHSSAMVINVGKRCGQNGYPQPEVNALMVRHAAEGRVVARLKSGDPTLFARLGEELHALREAGITFEIVPGVTAMTAASAAAGLTLTDRRFASSLVVLSGHQAGTPAWPLPSWPMPSQPMSPFSCEKSSYVVYMPGPDYENTASQLMSLGIAPATPCVLVSQAGRAGQHIDFMTVGRLAAASGVSSPAILIVGRVAGGLGLSQSDRDSASPKPAQSVTAPELRV